VNEHIVSNNTSSSREIVIKREPIAGGQIISQELNAEVLDVAGLFRVFHRRRKVILLSALVFILLAGLACLFMTPRYKATARIELLLHEEGAITAPAGENQTQPGATQAEDALNFSLSLQTATEVLDSEALALRVIHELNLVDDPDFRYAPAIMDEEKKREMSLPIEQSRLRRAAILKTWSKRLKVSSDAGTRIISVSFQHRNPDMAAKIVNQLIQDYIGYRYEVRFAAAHRTGDWLQAKLGALRADAEDKARLGAQVEKDTGTYGPNGSDHNIIIGRLEQLNTAAVDAQNLRTAKEAIYNLARNGDPELIAGLLSAGSLNGSSNSTQSSVLGSLRQMEADLNTQIAEASVRSGSANPRLIELKRKLDSVRGEIQDEVKKIAGRARQEYLAALQAEDSANKALEDEKRIAADINEKTADYNLVRHEADSAEQLYQSMLAASKQTAILAGIRSTDVNVVDAAAAPGKTSTPNVPLFLAGGLAFGLLFGTVAAFVRDSVDTRLRDPEEIERITQVPLLGIIPRFETSGRGSRSRKKSALAAGSASPRRLVSSLTAWNSSAVNRTTSIVIEAFRSVRSSILLSQPDNPRRVFLITSPLPGEGKSFVALHLATVLSESGASVLLVDADLRRGTLSRNLKRFSRIGLSSLLSGSHEENSAFLTIEGVPGVTFLPSGAAPPNPPEFLSSNKMKQAVENWKCRFDYVVLDSPPILPVTDPSILAQIVDGVVVVVRAAVSTRKPVQRALNTLMRVRADLFGIIMNDVDLHSSDYGYYGNYDDHRASGDKFSDEPLTTVAAGGE